MVFIAKFVDQTQCFRLFTAEDAAIGKAADRLFRQRSPFRHNANKLSVAAVDQLLQQRALLRAEGAVRGKNVFKDAAFDGVETDADPFKNL